MLKAGTPPDLDGPWPDLHGTVPTTPRTSLRRAQALAWLESGGFQDARDQATGGGDRRLFHLIQLDVQSGPLGAERTTSDHFSPPLGQFGQARQICGSQLP
jgi:hypothetical protein